MGDKYDWKKIIQMVAVIGVLCIFVGVFTRIMQKNQTSLSDYAVKNPEIALAQSENSEESKTEDASLDSSKENSEESSLDSTKEGSKDTITQSGKESGKEDAKGSEDAGADKPNDDADAFYYTDLEDGYKFHILYYNSTKEVCTAEIVASPEDPYNALEICYDLYKAEHIFEDVSKLQEFFDKL